jgi:hypothetical protein
VALPETRVQMFDRRMTSDDVNELNFYELEGQSLASEKAIFDYGTAPGNAAPRTQRPQRDPDRIVDDPELWDEGEIFDAAFSDAPIRDPRVMGRRSSKE